LYSAPSLLAILPFPQIDPIAFSIGPVAVHWYGLAYVAGILLGWLYAKRMVARADLWPGGVSPMAPEKLDDFLVWVAGGIVLGGRIGYILFYDLGSVIANPIRAVEIWNGGMSFHGGALGVSLGILYRAWKEKLSWLRIHDYVACCVPFGLFFGRLANFVNGELWGRETDVAFGDDQPQSKRVGRIFDARRFRGDPEGFPFDRRGEIDRGFLRLGRSIADRFGELGVDFGRPAISAADVVWDDLSVDQDRRRSADLLPVIL